MDDDVDDLTRLNGHTIRPPVTEDAPTIFDLFASRNRAVVGMADLTFDDIVDELAEPGFDPAHDGWLAFDETGQPSGYACVYRSSEPEHRMEVVADDPVLAARLRDWAIERSREIARSDGHDEVAIDIGIYRADEAQRTLIAEAGFERGTTYHRMRIDHTGPAAPPELPAGVVRRSGAEGADVRRGGHSVIDAAFTGQFGITAQPFDEWHAAREARTTFDWSQLVVLELDGEPVAAREDNDQFVEDEDCGYVARLGVLDAKRGRGLAKLLLLDGFATHAAAGRTGTILHVDTNNPTPALGLYTAVGMQAVLVIDVWRTTLPT